ncbi:MAG TPA: RES domain-containing protein [Castellaniella sp.]|uniref:RES family NAD+ phosphorylase n=1 Tax=Castellaniella sp. TaxID=1955812 RepID=UPI002F0DE7B1
MSSPDEVAAYRLVKKKWARNAFDGEGAKRYGGRFNSKGRPCVYLAGSESLAILEVMVHLDDYQLLDHYALFRLALPLNSVLQLDGATLPSDWREDPAPADTARLGDDWLSSGASLALAVPSTVVIRETNYLLNPAHPDFERVVSQAEPLSFTADARLR